MNVGSGQYTAQHSAHKVHYIVAGNLTNAIKMLAGQVIEQFIYLDVYGQER